MASWRKALTLGALLLASPAFAQTAPACPGPGIWGWTCRYAAEDAALDPADPPEVVFMGDSISEFWLAGDPALFAHEQSQNATKGPWNLDRGISGQTSPQMLLRFTQDVIALHPRIVHILAGTNDIAGNNGPTSDEAYENTIRAMADLARANGIAIILGTIPPAAQFSWRPELKPAARIAALNAWLRDFARQRHLVLADYYTPLAEADGAMRAAFTADGVHPNPAGYAAMRPVFEAALLAARRSHSR